MQQTETYKLNLIENTDAFSPEPINESMELIDSALTELAGGFVVIGSFASTNSSAVTITLGFKPKALIIIGADNGAYPALGVKFSEGDGIAVSASKGHTIGSDIVFTDTGFKIAVGHTFSWGTGYTVSYLAFK